MAQEYSFDIVSDFDPQELVNAVDQVRRELSTRYDLKDSGSTLDLEADKQITITTKDTYALQSIYDLLGAKVSKRGLSPLILDPGKAEESLGGKVRQHVKLRKGIDRDLARRIVDEIKASKLKVQPSIQGDQVRVSSRDKDILQTVIQLIRENADRWNVPLQFTNYR